ncbi:hypothetical protein AURDEDRAFT_115524 [Auricularia subglabra TFB-10046 SS5]|nr:hypothetical protein AURDEDRAFT_115524 [Auricularia subglabra TFB-10046 SS5]
MFSVPLSAYAGYPHRTPKLSLCSELTPCQDHVYTLVSGFEPDVLANTDNARARYMHAGEGSHVARRAYADTIALDQLQRLHKLGSQPVLHPRSLSDTGAQRPRFITRPPHRRQSDSAEELSRSALEDDAVCLRDECEIQRRRHQLFAEQAHASRMRAREHAFSQALRVGRTLARRSAQGQASAHAESLSPTKTAIRPHALVRLRITAAPSIAAQAVVPPTPSKPVSDAPARALDALKNLESELAAVPLDVPPARRKHMLARLLERADAVESGGHESVRMERRAFVRKVQGALDSLELHG